MKKLLPLLLMLALSLVLAACSSDKAKDKEKEDKPATNEAATVEENPNGVSDGAGGMYDPTSVDNEFFKSVHTLLKNEGYEVGELIATDYTFLKARQSVRFTVNGEDILQLQIHDLDPASEDLAIAKETGMAPAVYEGQEGEIPVLVLDHYYLFMKEGHPDQEDIYKLLEEEYKK